MPKGIYTRDGIYWARFKIKGVEYREIWVKPGALALAVDNDQAAFRLDASAWPPSYPTPTGDFHDGIE